MSTRLIITAAILIVAGFRVVSAGESDTERFLVSIPSLRLEPKERIIGFDIHIRPGRISRVADVPTGWEICIHNEPSWISRISGAFAAGSMALGPKFFKDFMLIEKDRAPEDVPFDVHGEIIVSADFQHERRIEVTLKDFALTKETEK